MKRALAFLAFGPALAAVAAMLVMTQAAALDREFAKLVAIAAFFFALPVASITGCIDGVLGAVSAPARAALSAAVGALVAPGLAFILFSWLLPREVWFYFAFGGATCMGACSLLASEFAAMTRSRFAA